MTAILASSLAYAWNGVPLPEEGPRRIGVEIGAESGYLPPFSVARQDQSWAALEGRWAPTETVGFRLRYEWLAARWPDQAWTTGSGDIRLASSAWAFSGDALRLGLDVEVKLPNADDRTGLGTDETDVETAALARWTLGQTTIDARAGLLILGNPTQYAAQDDAFTFLVGASQTRSATSTLVWVGGRAVSPRNPADVSAGVAFAWTRERLRVDLGASVGVSPLAPDVGLRMGVALVPPGDGA